MPPPPSGDWSPDGGEYSAERDDGDEKTDVELEKGRSGQFEILVNERSVVSRKGGLIAKITGRSEGNVGNILHHAVRKLSRSLGAVR